MKVSISLLPVFDCVELLLQVRWLILAFVVVLGVDSFTLPPLYPIVPPPIGYLPYFMLAKGTLVWASKLFNNLLDFNIYISIILKQYIYRTSLYALDNIFDNFMGLALFFIQLGFIINFKNGEFDF